MDRMFASPPKATIKNERTISKVLVFDNRRLFEQAQAAFQNRQPLVSVSFVEAKEPSALRQELAKYLLQPEKTLLLAEVDSDRGVKFETVAQALREITHKAAFALLTQHSRVIGLESDFAAFTGERGFDPAILHKVDYVFRSGETAEKLWEAKDVLRAAVEVHEDRLNFRFDNEKAIIVVEDKPGKYTDFLMMLYGLSHRRSRLLLARTYEEASELVAATKDNMVGAIIDMRFPKNGKLDENAFMEIREQILAINRDMPIVLTSGDQGRVAEASKLAYALWDHDPQLLRKMSKHMGEDAGFGPFIFRDEKNSELFRAQNYAEFVLFVTFTKNHLETSVLRHAEKDHFRKWLLIHEKKEAAEKLSELSKNLGQLYAGEAGRNELLRGKILEILRSDMHVYDQMLAGAILAFGMDPKNEGEGRYKPAIVHDPNSGYQMEQSRKYLEREIALAKRMISIGERRNTPAGEKLKKDGYSNFSYYSRLLNDDIRGGEQMKKNESGAQPAVQMYFG